MRGVPQVIHGAGIAKGCLISRGGGFGQYKRLPPAQGSSFDHLHFSSPLSTAQQGKLDFATCLSFGILCSPGLLQGCLVWDWTLQKILGSRIGFWGPGIGVGLRFGLVLDSLWQNQCWTKRQKRRSLSWDSGHQAPPWPVWDGFGDKKALSCLSLWGIQAEEKTNSLFPFQLRLHSHHQDAQRMLRRRK